MALTEVLSSPLQLDHASLKHDQAFDSLFPHDPGEQPVSTCSDHALLPRSIAEQRPEGYVNGLTKDRDG
jgi:hypothetical protein